MRVFSILVLALLSVSAIRIADKGVPAELGGKPAKKGGKPAELGGKPKAGKEYINGMNLPARTKNVIKPSSIVVDTLKDGGKGPIKPSAGESEKGPTPEYAFSPDSKGPHKVEV
jgi:hypothetical protein